MHLSILKFLLFLNSHLLHFFFFIWITAFSHLLTFIMPLYILFLVFIDPLHVLNHLLVTWRNNVPILVLHNVVILWTHAFGLFAFRPSCTFLFLEKSHIELNTKRLNQKYSSTTQLCIVVLTSFFAFSYTLRRFYVMPSSAPKFFSAKFTAFLYDNIAAG